MPFQWINEDFGVNVHRSGWKEVAAHLKTALAPYAFQETFAIDLYVDATFYWRESIHINSGIIPYKTSWIGFIHHTTTGFNDSGGLFDNENFIESLHCCKGLIVLSEHLKRQLTPLCPSAVPIHVLTHPTEDTDVKFTMGKFISNREKRLLHIGNWMRDVSQFQRIIPNPMYKKTVLRSIRNDHGSLVNDATLELMGYLPDDEYDDMLSRNIACIFLRDASAINTVLECIVRNCPILVNGLPAIREVLGEEYPLYITGPADAERKMMDISLISRAFAYLRNLPKARFQFSYFVERFKYIVKEHVTLDERQCIICLDPLMGHEGGTKFLTCMHEFGKPCIEDWVQRGNRFCPVCRGGELPPPTAKNPPAGTVFTRPTYNHPGNSSRYNGHSYHNR